MSTSTVSSPCPRPQEQALLSLYPHHSNRFCSNPCRTGYNEDDFPTQLPYKLHTVGLVLDTKEEHFGLHANADWATQEYPSDGFTDLGPSNRTFVVSMVHQMHCLEIFRVGFTTNPPGYAHHVEHCLRYMRQMVLCHADTTLESAEPVFVEGSWRYGASGVGSVYKCKDWTALREYLEENPAHKITGRG